MPKHNDTHPNAIAQSYVINENGEEVPITDEMVNHSMADIKLQSIGVHTGFQKVITDDMLKHGKKLNQE